MAYEIKPQDDEQQPGQGQNAIPGTTSSPPSQYSTPQSAGGYGSSVPNSKFVNFDRLLDANKSSAQNEANSVVGSVGQAAGDAQSQLDQRVTSYNSAVSAGTPTYMQQNPHAVSSGSITGVSTIAPGPGTHVPFDLSKSDLFPGLFPSRATHTALPPKTPLAYGGPPASASQLAGSANAMQSFLQPGGRNPIFPKAPSAPDVTYGEALARANGGYVGPKSLDEASDWNDFATGASKAAGRAAALGTPGTLQAEVQRQTGSKGTADSALDASLIGAVARPQINDLSSKYAKFDQTLSNSVDKSRRQGDDAAALANQGQQYWKGQVDARDAKVKAAARVTAEAAEREKETNEWQNDPEGYANPPAFMIKAQADAAAKKQEEDQKRSDFWNNP